MTERFVTMRRATAVAAQFCLSFVALGAIIAWSGTAEFWRALSAPRWGFLLAAAAVASLQFPLLAARWWFVARKLSVPLGYGRALGEYYVGSLLNQVLPFGVLGDALRAVRHARYARSEADASPARVALAVVLERASGQLALWVVVLVVLPSWSDAVQRTLAVTNVPTWLAALPFVTGVVFWLALRRRPAASRLRVLAASGARVLVLPRNFAVHSLLSLALVLSHVLVFICAAGSLGSSLPLVPALRVVPLVLVASTLPAFFSGWGIREAAAAGLYQLAGLSAADGAAIALVFGAVGLVASAPGLLLLISTRAGARTRSNDRAAAAACAPVRI
jgi:uncharacterized membrane protein YbhN (UPF0104 family)